jgi:hypothetical protein
VAFCPGFPSKKAGNYANIYASSSKTSPAMQVYCQKIDYSIAHHNT